MRFFGGSVHLLGVAEAFDGVSLEVLAVFKGLEVIGRLQMVVAASL